MRGSTRMALVSPLLVLAGWLCSDLAEAAGDPLFEADEVLEITLRGPLNRISRDRAAEPELSPGTLTYAGPDGAARTLSVQLEPRGKSRRDREVCTFPPLWVHFDKDQVKGTLFAKQDKLKAVTHCRSPESFQDYVLKEYLAYRIFNALTDESFRVRLLLVSWEESESGRRPMIRYGFFIEHKKRLAKRLGREVVEPEAMFSPSLLLPEPTALAELFQFMVSNTDFSFRAPPVDDVCCHNAVLFAAGEGRYLPVPYDFDRTGLVSPPNGLPDAQLGQRSFRDRRYRGFCHDEAVMEAALERTRAARAGIEALISGQADLGARARSQALDFIAGYYEIIDDPRRRERFLKCRDVQ